MAGFGRLGSRTSDRAANAISGFEPLFEAQAWQMLSGYSAIATSPRAR
jgi:hypothetical protein